MKSQNECEIIEILISMRRFRNLIKFDSNFKTSRQSFLKKNFRTYLYAHDVSSACFESILYVRSERRQCFDARFDLKNIAMKNDKNDETNEQLIVNFFKIWYVILSVKNRKFELLMFFKWCYEHVWQIDRDKRIWLLFLSTNLHFEINANRNLTFAHYLQLSHFIHICFLKLIVFV